MTKEKNIEVNKRAKLYVVGRYDAKILDELQSRCSGVDFIGKDVDLVIEKIKLETDLDGILAFGSYYDRELISIGLPVIMVTKLWGDAGVTHFYRNDNVLTAILYEHDISPSVYSVRLNDLARKINLIAALKKLKRTRLLNIVPENLKLNFEDLIGNASNRDYEEVYFKNLKILGLEVVDVSVDEINEEREKADKEEAKKIADKWIYEAQEVRWKEISKEQIIMSAQLYLGTVKLMKKYDCDTVTMSIGPVLRIGKMPVRPPLAEMELAKNGIVTSCESLIDCLITQILGFYITGRLSFIGDVLGIDPVNSTVAYGHCYAPINPHGNDRVPYIIRNHAVTPTTVGIQVELPINETVTVLKISLYDKKISIFTGITVDGRSLYKNFDNIACRTKVVVKTNNVEALLKNYDREIFGCHRVIFYGDFREEIKNLATLIDFKVIEKDK